MMEIDPAIGNLLALALALIFGASGVMKLRDLEMFESSLANYQLAPAWMEKPLAYALPLAECGCALALIFASTRTSAALGLLLLLATFSGAIAINLARGRVNIDCGCFGPALRQQLSGWLLVRNLFLIALVAVVALPSSDREIEWIDAVTIVFGAATLIILYASANFAIANIPKLRALELM